MPKPTMVAVGVLKINGKLAMIQFKRNMLAGYWGLPGGKIDAGESLPEAIEREFFEEVEIRVRYKQLLAVLDDEITSQKSTDRYMILMCEVEATGEVNLKRLEHDEGIVDWYSEQQIRDREMPLVPSDYQVIERVVLGKERGYFYSKIDVSGKKPKLIEFRAN